MQRFFDRLNLTPAERRLVVIILSVVFLVVNYWLVWPRFGDFKVIQNDIAAMERKREAFQREIDRRPTYEATLRKLQSLGSEVPQGEERIAFRSDMERLVRDVGLMVPRWSEVTTDRASGSSSNAFFDTISLSLSQVTASEAQFVDFLYRVGASNSTIRVKDLTLAPGAFDARSQGKTNLTGSVKLVAAIQRASPKPAPGAPSGATNATAAATSGSRSNAAVFPTRSLGAGRTNIAALTNRVNAPLTATAGRTNAAVPGARTNAVMPVGRTNAPPGGGASLPRRAGG